MKREVRIEGKTLWIDVTGNGESVQFAKEGEPVRTASIVEAENGVYSVLVEGKSYRVRLARGKEQMLAALCGREYTLEVIDPRRPGRRPSDLGADGNQVLIAPMPGKVIRRLVAEGDFVEAGQGVIVVEAMKMQNEMRAHRAGKVIAMPVDEGTTVSAGETLAVLE